MRIKNSLVCLLLFIVSCKDVKKNEATIQLNTKQNVATDTKIINGIGETLNVESKKLIEDWPEYTLLDKTLNDYYNISSDEALFKAKDLSNYALQLRDSVRINMLDRADMKIRLNVLYNTSLRLSDMETIKSIEYEEVKMEVANILNAFSAVNSKINNIVSQKNIEKELILFENQ